MATTDKITYNSFTNSLCFLFVINIVPFLVVTASENLLNLPLSSESEESDNEEELMMLIMMRKGTRKQPQRIQYYIEDTVMNFTGQQFQQNFRVTVDAYESLLKLIGPTLKRKNRRGRHTINIDKQILSVLWLLATPDSYRSVAERFDMGKSSLSVCFVRIVNALCKLAPTIISWPSGQRLIEINEKFRRMAGLRHVLGAIDGTYIDIKAPMQDPESYITRKCRHSMTLQGTTDPNLKFIDAFVGYPGSVHDNRIFRNSDLYLAVRNNMVYSFPNDQYIIGDKADPCLSWCIPPYINRGNLTIQQQYFNTSLARTRQTIERAFALFFGRFRRMKFVDMQRTDRIPCTVLASCVLHNICLDYTDLEVDNYIREGRGYVRNNEEDHLNILNDELKGRNKRDAIWRQVYALRNV